MMKTLIKIGYVVVTIFLLLLVHANSECLKDSINGFRPGINRQDLAKEFDRNGWPFNGRRRSRDGMEFFYVPQCKLKFWINSSEVIAVGGESAIFRGRALKVNISEAKVVELLGKPYRDEVQEAMEDVGNARYLYYQGEELALKVALGNPLARGQSDWVVTNLYLFEAGSAW